MEKKKFILRSFSAGGFTLIEMLVVISIISILAGQLLPSLSTAREKGRQANCINNLKQFSLAIEMYSQDFKDYPPWLSSLYPDYLSHNKTIFVCITDRDRGNIGHGQEAFPEANDIPPPNIPGAGYSPPYAGGLDGFNQRNPEITACSYMYDFNPNECEWFMMDKTPQQIAQADRNGDGIVSWKEAMLWQSDYEGKRGQVPIVRCFWHYRNYKQKVLNLAYRDYNVFTGEPEWDSSSY